jgi:hypothetical protein
VIDARLASKAPSTPRSGFLRFSSIALGLLGVAYVAEGYLRSLSGPLPQDLARRWLENAYFVRHVNSLDVFAGTAPIAPDIGPAHPGGYPPWSLVLGLLVAPPINQELLRWYFALLNAFALAAVVVFARRMSAPYGTAAVNLVTASVLAVSANAVTLRNGQYGLLINGFLAALLAAFGARRPLWGGLFLAFAALKPQSSGPFALLLLARRRWLAALTAAVVLGACTFGAALWLESSPLRLLSQVFGQASHWEGGDTGILRLLLLAGVPRGPAISGLAVTSLVVGTVLYAVHRERSLPVQAAIACVVARMWAYHRRYDDMLLVFLLVPLALAAFERPTRGAWLAFVSVGVTLWLPFREVDHGALLVLAKVLVWFGGLAWLLRSSYGRDAEKVPSVT